MQLKTAFPGFNQTTFHFIFAALHFIFAALWLHVFCSHRFCFYFSAMLRILLLFLFIPFDAAAQQPDIVFHHITEKEGLSYNVVNCFLKDSRGMLWIGTYNGLNRYDGHHFYTYHSGRTKNTLSNNSIHKLAEDSKGNIWGGTDNGVFCLNIKTGQFKNYFPQRKKGWPGASGIYSDRYRNIWATGDFGLLVYNEKTDSFETAPFTGTPIQGSIRKNGMAESPDGKGFWVATRDGLQYYDRETKNNISGDDDGDSSLINRHSASALCKTPYGHYWYTDNVTKTIIGFEPMSRKIKYRIKADSTAQIADGATLFEDNNHMLWFCNWRYELYMIDYLHDNTIKRIRHNKDDPTSIAGDFFWDVMQETDGTLWFGTVAGISKCNFLRSFYKVHHLPAAANTADNPAIEFISENPYDKTWWLTTTKNTLVNYNPANSKSVLYELDKFVPNKKNKTPYRTNRLIFFKDSILLFSHSGVWLKKGSRPFLPIDFPSPYDDFLTIDAVQYDDRTIYGIARHKMLKWDVQSNTMDSIVFSRPFLINGMPARLGQPHVVNKKVWVLSTNDWLVYAEGKELKAVRMNYQDSTEQDDGYFTDMTTDSKGAFWITKKGDGLIWYNPASNSSKQLKQHDGLVQDHVMAVAEDSSGRIWSGCFNQFSVYNPLLNSFYNFTLPLSLNNYAYVNLMATLSNRHIIGNVAGDIVEFFPDRLKAPSVKDKPLISLVSVNGADTNLYYFDNINLSPHENSLRIKFGMLTDIDAMPYDMLYIMEGAEKKWNIATQNYEANYNSLPAGDYTFRVKAVAKDKSWQTAETVLQIHISTPFYKAWWFVLLCSLTFFSGLFMLYRMRIRQKEKMLELQGKAQVLEKEKTQVMYENLKQHLNPHFLFNSLTSLSSLIRIDQKQAGNFLEKMSKVYRYILKNRDNETVSLADEIKFVQLYIDLQKTRFEKGLVINMSVDEEHYHRKIAPVTMQNLVENAIKHNTADAESPLVIDLFVVDDYLVVKNNLQKKGFVETSNKQGLGNMQSLYRFLSDRKLTVEETEKEFLVRVPLI